MRIKAPWRGAPLLGLVAATTVAVQLRNAYGLTDLRTLFALGVVCALVYLLTPTEETR